MIMKTVSILLVNSRRVCNQLSKDSTNESTTAKRRRNRTNKMEDTIGKPTPKLLESLKRKTHFSK